MNFLAHMYLSCGEEELIVGNFLADFIKNKDRTHYSDMINLGIDLHRKIDSYTDTHPIVSESAKLLHGRHHKYAPVVLDIFYDYILAKNWERYSAVAMEDFTQDIYRSLTKYEHSFPEKVRRISSAMIKDDFLMRYRALDGIQYAFSRIAKRAKFASNFETAVEDLKKHYDELERGFNIFFPQLIEEVDLFCDCN